MAGPGNQVIGASASLATLLINAATYNDTSGMAYPTYNQIISPAGNWWVLFTLHVQQSNSNASYYIQQWNGSAWVSRASFSPPAAAQFASFQTVAFICNSQYGTQFQFAITNNNASNITIISLQVTAVIIGRVA
jgi:hypothetical protein